MNEWNPDDLIEETWHDLKGEVSKSRVREVVLELVAKYGDAKVQAFLPVLIRRQAIERLSAELGLAAFR